ncbi:hypothetical protein K0M31_010065 [Melipona bicolor]|uniref:Growth arrest-specific protein 2 n=1 Tax=Melipona bicolor TaxID=60889 RepID=A0AA40FM59_9HYME|nr:hypothetical protein K0M31_010065 [Melipona bicolor]
MHFARNLYKIVQDFFKRNVLLDAAKTPDQAKPTPLLLEGEFDYDGVLEGELPPLFSTMTATWPMLLTASERPFTQYVEPTQRRTLELPRIKAQKSNSEIVSGDNFFDALDNGVVVCRLARIIQEKARTAIDAGKAKGPMPVIKGRCWENAARRSFFSRDNMENFIQFCRRLGVHENLLFESDDLVLHGQPRNVVLCLLEVARLASRYSVEPPGLVQLEREIAAEQERDLHCLSDSGISHSSLVSWQFQSPSPTATPRPPTEKIKHSSSASEVALTAARWLDPSTGVTHEPEMRRSVSDNGPAGSDGVPSDTTEDEWSRGSAEDPDELPSPSSSPLPSPAEPPEHTGPITELDRKVRRATEAVQRLCQCPSERCSKLKVRKVGEGRYHIAGRNVFIRLLKGRHMMVRVGGGWDTLEHFLARHDPCQVRTLNRESTPPSPHGNKLTNFLPIRAKYRSPPPESVSAR